MNIKGIIGSALIGTTSLLPTSCYKQEAIDCWNSRENLLEEVMLDKPQTELDNIKAKLSSGDIKVAETQHSIDSVVFRDMFQGSQVAQDSSFIVDYNNMMAKTKTPAYFTASGGKSPNHKKLNHLLSEQLSVREMKNVMKNPVMPENGGNGYFGTGKQYLVDSVYHHKLFEKYNLLDKNGMKKFKDLCRKVRP